MKVKVSPLCSWRGEDGGKTVKELCVDNIRKSFGAVRALDGVSFCCRSGEILGLIGANGSGKTTLSRIIAGIITPDSGKIIADGQELCFRHPREARSRGIVMAHQNLSLIENLSIWENIALDHEFLTPKGFLDDKRSRAFVEEWLHKVGIEIDLDTKVESLSPDLRQVLEIVKAMSWDPSLLLLDEPTASLDYEKVRLVFELIRKEKEKGKLIVFVSHRINEIVELCDRIVVLRNGRKVVELDTSSDACDQRTIVEFMVGEGIGLEKEKRCFVFGESDQSRDKSKIVLEVKHLSVAKRVDDVSLFLRQGEFLGIGGLQGQGQEELLLALFGAIPVSSGEIKFSGRSVNFAHPIDAIKAGVVLIPGDRQREGLFFGTNYSV